MSYDENLFDVSVRYLVSSEMRSDSNLKLTSSSYVLSRFYFYLLNMAWVVLSRRVRYPVDGVSEGIETSSLLINFDENLFVISFVTWVSFESRVSLIWD